MKTVKLNFFERYFCAIPVLKALKGVDGYVLERVLTLIKSIRISEADLKLINFKATPTGDISWSDEHLKELEINVEMEDQDFELFYEESFKFKNWFVDDRIGIYLEKLKAVKAGKKEEKEPEIQQDKPEKKKLKAVK
jgi:hypothetical protein